MKNIKEILFGRPLAKDHRKAQPLMFSSVGGGPLARVTACLNALGTSAQMREMMSFDKWRSHFKGTKFDRMAMRLATMVSYPTKMVLDSLKASTVDNAGSPLQAPVLVVTTNPFVLPFVAAATKPLHRCSVVSLMYDMYPDALEAAGMTPNLLTRLLESMNAWTIKHVDGVVYLGDVMRESAESRYGVHPNTWIIDNGADPNEFANVPAALDPSFHAWMNGRTIFSYVGNMGVMHDYETLERAIPQFLNSLDDEARQHVGFVFASTGQGAAKLEAALKDSCADNVKFIGPQPDDKWADLLVHTDVALATLTNRAWATSVPSKSYSAIGAGCALLAVCPTKSDLAHLIVGNDAEQRPCVGEFVEPGDVDGLVEKFRAFSRRETLDAIKPKLQKAAERYDARHMAELWQQCFEKVVASAPESWAAIAYRLTKRAFDVTASAVGLAVIAPLLAATALMVKIKLGSPIIFTQPRPGMDCEPFNLYKFRSMRVANENNADVSHDGERLTEFGKTIRSLSIDELPSLVNVLKGELSLVGPRPQLMEYAERYNADQIRRQWVMPGITGWAQVNGRNSISWEEKFRFDTWYVEHANAFLDLKILLMTIPVVFKRTGISHVGSSTMPEFKSP